MKKLLYAFIILFFIAHLADKYFQSKSASNASTETTSPSGSSYSSGSYIASKTCSYCGKSFTGNGYNYTMGECHSGEGGYYSKCSVKCCNEARKNDSNLSKKWKQ